jgi:hypothetical protein
MSDLPYRTIGSITLRGYKKSRGQIVPLPELVEESIDAKIILIAEEAISSPSINRVLHDNFHKLLRGHNPIGDKVHLMVREENSGWRLAFLPPGWVDPVPLGFIDSVKSEQKNEHGFYSQHTRGLLETLLDKLPKGRFITVGREGEIPGLSMVNSLSRQHTYVKKISSNLFYVKDLDSKNGTFALMPTNTKDMEWVQIKGSAELPGGTLLTLGSSSKAFQFSLPEFYNKEILGWKSIIVNTALSLQPGQIFSVLCPEKKRFLKKPSQFEIMREVQWSYKLHLLSKREKIYAKLNAQSSELYQVEQDTSISPYQELRIGSPNGIGFFLPGFGLTHLSSTHPGKVLTIGSSNFINPPNGIEAHHVAILVIDRSSFLVLNKSIYGSVYYKYDSHTWKKMREIMRLPAGTDVLLGLPNNGIAFTLPRCSGSASSSHHSIDRTK